MSIAILLQQILIIFLEIGTGAAVTNLGIMDDGNSKFLSNLVMSVTLPCTLLASASIDGGREAVAGMLKGYVVLEIFYILTIGICLVLSRAMHLTRGQKAVLVGAAVMPNSAFIGIPLISALLGSEAGALYGAAGIMAYNILFFTYVQHLFDPEAVLAQNFLRDLAVQLVVLHQQDAPALEVGILLGQKLLRRICLVLPEGAHQGLAQVGHEHRLGAEGGHTGCLCLHLNIRPVVGGQDNNRCIIVQAADLTGDLNAVHVRLFLGCYEMLPKMFFLDVMDIFPS